MWECYEMRLLTWNLSHSGCTNCISKLFSIPTHTWNDILLSKRELYNKIIKNTCTFIFSSMRRECVWRTASREVHLYLHSGAFKRAVPFPVWLPTRLCHKIIKSREENWYVSLAPHTLTHVFGNRGDPTWKVALWNLSSSLMSIRSDWEQCFAT